MSPRASSPHCWLLLGVVWRGGLAEARTELSSMETSGSGADLKSGYRGDDTETVDSFESDGRGGGADEDEEYDSADEDEDYDSGEDEDYDEDEEDEEEEEEEDEPRLKYQRLDASVPKILRSDRVSCFAAHELFLIIGTEGGFLHQLDLNGNEILRRRAHSKPVSWLSFDSDGGEHVASCSSDGSVVITNLFGKNFKTVRYGQAVSCVSLCPGYKQQRMFVAGGPKGSLFFSSKGFFGDNNKVIHSGEGAIGAVSWHGSYIAWANDYGVKAINATTRAPIAHVARPGDAMDINACRCSIVWCGKSVMLLGWGDCVQVCEIHRKKGKEIMKITAKFRTDYAVAGIAPFSLSPSVELVILAYMASDGKAAPAGGRRSSSPSDELDGKSAAGRRGSGSSAGGGAGGAGVLRPELRIVAASTERDITRDSIPVRGYKSCSARDYWLASMASHDEQLYYIVSPTDIVVARPRDWDDHVGWLMKHERYREALKEAEENKQRLKTNTIEKVRERYLRHLVRIGNYQKAAELCPRLLCGDSGLWEEWVRYFHDQGRIATIAPFIPWKAPRLPANVYTSVLKNLIATNPTALVTMLQCWPQGIYDMKETIGSLEDKLNHHAHPADAVGGDKLSDREADSPELQKALAELYMMDKQFKKALKVYLELKSNDVFSYVEKLDLFLSIKDYALQMMELDVPKTIELFLKNIDRISVSAVCQQLSDEPRLLHKFLHALFEKDPTLQHGYHDQQVKLYIRYDRAKLGSFLETSNRYNLEQALKVCKENRMYDEVVSILKRMGSTTDALMILIKQKKDVKKAIAFVESVKDDDLWDELIQHSLESNLLLSDLLGHVGNHYVDALKLVEQIPEDKKIKDLKQKILGILRDKMLQVSVQEGVLGILARDCVELNRSFVAQRTQAVMRVDSETKCCFCSRWLLASRGGLRICYAGGRAAHARCMEAHEAQEKKRLAEAEQKLKAIQEASGSGGGDGSGVGSIRPKRTKVGIGSGLSKGDRKSSSRIRGSARARPLSSSAIGTRN